MSGMHRLFKGCLLAALLLASPAVPADQASDRERERERGDRRYGDSGYNGGNESDDSRDCIEGSDDTYRGRDCDNVSVNDSYGTTEYIVQPNRVSAYDGVGQGRREIDRGHISSRQIHRGGGGGRR
jgi:hypothetical protein